MRKMTKEQAENYIKTGYFPMPYEMEAICDLQDVFGHQSYWDIIGWAYNKETRINAFRLYYLIWNKDDVMLIEKKVRHVGELVEQKRQLEAQLAKINREIELNKYMI